MLSDIEREFLTHRRIGHLATAGHSGNPHLVPVCFVVHEQALYTAIDEKPKSGQLLRRLRNILENPNVTFLADHYEEDWSRLGWIRIDGTAELLSDGPQRTEAIRLLRSRYKQYAAMHLSAVIVIRIRHIRSWGNLDS
ncbi:MAG TPA: TIGR03668 family PPOX class F420-dependent oxidoreductase [Rhizomicrobium sp.]|jgi:PPOX class probable F420-dependent enzyme|nr:TIGR03668 family PPOX class F420-dependent oxidoreductase [Rhizomicrobium sp.]